MYVTTPPSSPATAGSPVPTIDGGVTADVAGPGSPFGSVRPVDLLFTADAPSPPPRQGRTLPTALVGAIVGAALGTAGTLAVVRTTTAYDPRIVAGAPIVQVADSGVSVVTAVAEAVTPSVVRIDIVVDGELDPIGLASGVIYRSDGYILTNNHVIEAADGLRVRLASGETIDAEVIGTDPTNDLAVLRVDRDGLPAVRVRTTAVRVGEQAVAIGSPFGLDASVTAGVVSALNRHLTDSEGVLIADVLQTDAAINPGNSGGALVDNQGQLIGINTAILSGSGGSQGVGFAISAAIAVHVADELIERGFIRHALLGVTGITLSEEAAARLGVDAHGGAVIDSVQPGSAAAAGGVRVGDLVVALDGEAIETMDALVLAIRRHRPGDVIVLEVVRDSQQLELTVTLGERPR